MIDLPSSLTSPRGGPTLQGILGDIGTGDVTRTTSTSPRAGATTSAR